jgi:hypothetical protein
VYRNWLRGLDARPRSSALGFEFSRPIWKLLSIMIFIR